MALTWQWSEKCGEATIVQQHDGEPDREFTLSLYKGNAYMIFLHEFTDEDGVEKYDLYSFWSDKEHARRLLGLNKKNGSDYNIYETQYSRMTKLRLNKKKHPYAADIAALLSRAFDSITIEIYSEEDGT